MMQMFDADGEVVVNDPWGTANAEPQPDVSDLEMCWTDDLNVLRELAALVVEMRQAQKAFFKERRYSDLDRSKRAERKVDELLKRHGVEM